MRACNHYVYSNVTGNVYLDGGREGYTAAARVLLSVARDLLSREGETNTIVADARFGSHDTATTTHVIPRATRVRDTPLLQPARVFAAVLRPRATRDVIRHNVLQLIRPLQHCIVNGVHRAVSV